MTNVATFILMCMTTRPSNSINILIRFRGVLGKINAGSKHSTDVRMSLIKALLNDCINKWTSMEENFLIKLAAILIGDFSTTVEVALEELAILDFLDSHNVVAVTRKFQINLRH